MDGNIYYNTIAVCVSNMTANLTGNYLIKRFKARNSFIYSYVLSAASFVVILLLQVSFDLDNIEFIMPILLLVAGFGIEIAFLVCYVFTFEYFPLTERGSALKWCNMVSRGITVMSPLVAELDEPWPVLCLLALVVVCLFAASFLINERKDETE